MSTMRRFSFGIKSLSVILSMLTAVLSLPLYVFSAEFRNTVDELKAESLPDNIDSLDAAASGYTSRVPSLEEDLFSYVFSKSDGTYECLTYDYPVKYYDSEGTLKDKTNLFKDCVASSGTCYVSADNDIITSVPSVLSDGISLGYGTTDVRMVYAGASYGSALPGNISADTANSLSVPVSMSPDMRRATYALSRNTSLEYTLTFNGFKEEIVVDEYDGITDYSFLLYTNGLSLVEEDGDFRLVDSDGTVRAQIGRIIVFTADEKNNAFGNMYAETVENNNVYRLTIHIEEEYLSSPDTAYPIRIDPSVEICHSSNGAGAIEDITVSDGTAYSGSATYLYVGKSNGKKYRTLVKFPNLTSSILGKNIVSASYEIRDIACESASLQIECRRYTTDNWRENTGISWDQAVSYCNGELLDTQYVFYGNGNVYGAGHRYSFDITSLAQKWAGGEHSAEEGIVLKAAYSVESGSGNNLKTFASYNRTSHRPSFRYSWTEASGLNSVWEFRTRQTGSCITAYENVLFGTAVIRHSLNIPTLNEFPLSSDFIFNSSYGEELFDKAGLDSSVYGRFGSGWKPGFAELCTRVNDSYGDPSQYCYVDGTGTEYYFTYDSDRDRFENSYLDAVLTIDSGSSGSVTLKYGDTERHFNSAGLLTSVVTGKKTYTYSYSGSKLSSISCGNKTLISLSYSGSYLSSVSYQVVLNNTTYTNTVSFSYTSGRLTSVTDPRGNTVTYTYSFYSSPANVLSGLTVFDSLTQTGLEYSFAQTGKISGSTDFRKNAGTGTDISSCTVSRATGRVDYTENGKKTSYVYDRKNRLVNTIETDASGSIIYGADYTSYLTDQTSFTVPLYTAANLLTAQQQYTVEPNDCQTLSVSLENISYPEEVDTGNLFLALSCFIDTGSEIYSSGAYIGSTLYVEGGEEYGEYYFEGNTPGLQYICCLIPVGNVTWYERLYLDFYNYTPEDVTFKNILLTYADYSSENAGNSYSRGLVYTSNNDGTCTLTGRGTCQDTEIVIPEKSPAGDTVTALSNSGSLFYNNTSVTSVTVPGTVTELGTAVFNGCTALKTVILEDGVEVIGASAFYGCSSLEYVSIPDSVTTVRQYAFYGCSSLESVYIPEGVTSLGACAFMNCTSLEDVTLGTEITELPLSAFNGCTSLKRITLPENLTAIRQNVFYGCSALKAVGIYDELTEIGTGSFAGVPSGLKIYYTGTSSDWSDITLYNSPLPAYTIYPNTELKGDLAYTTLKDSSGNVTQTTVRYVGTGTGSNASDLLFTSLEYDQNGYLTSVTDENGTETTYVYNRYGDILSTTVTVDAQNNVTSTTAYTYYTNGLLNTASSEGLTNTYSYTDGLLTGVVHTGTGGFTESYSYFYDPYGQLTSVKVGSKTLESYTYCDSFSGSISSVTYANGDTETYTYDSHGNVTGKLINNVLRYVWSYSIDGTLLTHEDKDGKTIERTQFDAFGYATGTKRFRLDQNDNETDVTVTPVSAEDGFGTSETDDVFGRTTGKTLYSTGGSSQTEIIAKTLEYVSNGSYSSYLVSEENYSEPGSDGIPKETVFQYNYNTRGNITGITEYRAYEDETYTQSFSYDGLSQLVREDNSRENATYVYVYDGNGNILEKNKYVYGYTDAAHKDTAGSVSYTYSTEDWKDLLTRIGNRTIVSDASGNPLNWTGANSTLTWTGRRLDTYTPDGNTLISYNYNSNGLRTKKTVVSPGTTTVYEYYYDNGELIREIRTVTGSGNTVTDRKTIDYLRLGGELIGFRLYGSSGNAVDYSSYDDYFYARTANGEIRIIYDEDGFVAARYSYDAWGRITGIDEEYSSCIGALNSIRYKDYYYDTESGFYYLQSRYYDPAVCRFISADSTDYLGASGSVLSFNLFGYCDNNPVQYDDKTGHVAQAIIGGIISGIIAFALYYLEYWLGMRAWNWATMVAIIIVNAAIGAATWFLGIGGGLQKLTKLYGIAHIALKSGRYANTVIKAISLIASSIKLLINITMKKATRKPGESWFSAIKRLLFQEFAISI